MKLISLLAVVAGCQQKTENTVQTSASEASAKPAGKVERAVANAVGAGAVAPAASSGPPADGILDPARAESEAPSGQAPKVTIGSNGSEPRIALRSAKAQWPRSMKIEVTVQAGMDQGLPPIEMTIGLESKPAVLATKAPGTEGVESKAASLIAKVRDAKVAMANVPAEFASQIAGLKGGKVSFSVAANGGAFGFASELGPGAKPELRDLLETIIEAMSLATLPLPAEPMGQGAFWMVVTRDKSAGFALASYHMVKLVRADEKTAELELDTRRYAIGRIVDPGLLPPGTENVSLKEISAGMKARMQLDRDLTVPTSVESNASLRGVLDGGDGAPKRAVQSSTNYRISATR